MTLDTDIADIEVREATLDDVIGIVYVQATTWIAAYASAENGVLEADIRSIDFKSKIINWQHLIQSPNYRVWVADKTDKIIGMIAVLKESDEAEVYEHCVLPDFWRRGLGTRLWQVAADWLKGLPVRLRIISYNQQGVAFYKQHGFKVSTLGEVDFIALPSGKNIPTIEMRMGNLPDLANTEQPVKEAIAEPEPNPEAEVEMVAPPRQTKQLVGRAELAKISNMRPSTIKYYTEIGLLPFEQVEARLARRYDRAAALSRLQTIRQLRSKGLSIKEIVDQLQ